VKKGINAVAWFAAQSFHGNASNAEAKAETKQRDLLSIAGAIREEAESNMKRYPEIYAFERFEQLATELEDAIVEKQFQDSLKMMRGK
jgi:hypothetical protein